MRVVMALVAVLSVGCVTPQIKSRPIGATLSDKVVAVASPGHAELTGLVEVALLEAGVEVVSRQSQGALVEEKKLQSSPDFEDASMVAFGQQLGASIMVVAKEIVADESIFDNRSRYGVRLTAIDVASSKMLGYAEVDAHKEAIDTWGDCDFACLKGRIAEMAVEELLKR